MTLLTVDRNVFGAAGWVPLLFVLEYLACPRSRVPPAYGEAITRGCDYVDDHLCVRGGCYYKPTVVHKGEDRPSLTRRIPSYVEIEHSVGYFRREVMNLTRAQSVECAVQHAKPHKMEILVSLIPALTLAGIIIVLLIFLRSANTPYVLANDVEPKGVDEIPMKQFTIADNDDEDGYLEEPAPVPKTGVRTVAKKEALPTVAEEGADGGSEEESDEELTRITSTNQTISTSNSSTDNANTESSEA